MESGARVGGWIGARGGRTLIGFLLCGATTIVHVAPAASADFYRWVDSKGVEHFSNVPTELPADRDVARIPVEPERMPAEEYEDAVVPGTAGSAAAPTPAEISLARDALHKEYRKITARIDTIDKELKDLASARTRWVREANPATGDTPATGAADVLSPEEEELAKERSNLELQAKDMKNALADLQGPK